MISKETEIKITETLVKRAEYIRMREELDKLIEECTDAVKSEMEMQSAEELKAGPYKVIWKEVTRATIDSKKLKELEPDTFAKYSKQTITRPFLVK